MRMPQDDLCARGERLLADEPDRLGHQPLSSVLRVRGEGDLDPSGPARPVADQPGEVTVVLDDPGAAAAVLPPLPDKVEIGGRILRPVGRRHGRPPHGVRVLALLDDGGQVVVRHRPQRHDVVGEHGDDVRGPEWHAPHPTNPVCRAASGFATGRAETRQCM